MRWALWALGLFLGCTGSIEGSSGDIDVNVDLDIDEPRGPNAPPMDDEGNLICEGRHVPATSLRRLTRDQYDATVATLLGDQTGPARAFPADDDIEGFLVAGTVSQLLVEQQRAVSEALAARAVLDLEELTGCGEASCAEAGIRQLATRAYRRPASDAELMRLRVVYDAGADHGAGMQLVIQAVLQSPHFLYHLEPEPTGAETDSIVPVAPFALANRLAYFLWGTMPDAALREAAEAGRLDDLEGLMAETDRMLEDGRAASGFRFFYRQWLKVRDVAGVVKDETLHPEWNADVARDLQRSLDRFLDDVYAGGDLNLLFTGTTHYVNARIAPFFNLDPAAFGDELEAHRFAVSQRAGVLTHPGTMALLSKSNQSDPIHRALFIRERILCQHLPPPPDDLVVEAPDPSPGLTTRERFAEHSESPACVGCHTRLDPLGFVFEHYDAVGAYRETDNGTTVDSSGQMNETRDLDGPLTGADDLTMRLGGSAEVQECVARQVFRFAIQRNETDADACSLQGIDASFADSGFDIRALLRAVVASEAFRFQRVQ
ncbi:MAG: DUF1588 domain-containing protein [Myxococcota bacterium]